MRRRGRQRLWSAWWAAGIASIIVLVAAGPAHAQQPTNSGDKTDKADKADKSKDGTEQKTDQPSGTSNNRLFGAVPDFLTVDDAENVPPLTAKQKFSVTLRSAVDPGQLLFCAALAGISQADNADPSYGQGAGGYSKRLGLAVADITIENIMVTAVFASALHQDPRYLRLGTGSVLSRGGYAVSRIFVTRSDSGHSQFNASEIFGAASAAALYNTYHPASDRTVSNTITSWWMQVGFDAGFIVLREFWPDIRHKL